MPHGSNRQVEASVARDAGSVRSHIAEIAFACAYALNMCVYFVLKRFITAEFVGDSDVDVVGIVYDGLQRGFAATCAIMLVIVLWMTSDARDGTRWRETVLLSLVFFSGDMWRAMALLFRSSFRMSAADVSAVWDSYESLRRDFFYNSGMIVTLAFAVPLARSLSKHGDDEHQESSKGQLPESS